MKKLILFAFFLTFLLSAKAQTNGSAFVKSMLILVSEDKTGREIKYSIEDAYMILNTSSGEFVLNADFSDIKTGDKHLDSLVRINGEQLLSFKGNIGENLLVFNQQQNDERTYPMSGSFNVNGSSVTCVAQFDPINLAEKSETKNYRMDFTLSVDASKIIIKGLESSFSKQIAFEIAAGKLNIQQ